MYTYTQNGILYHEAGLSAKVFLSMEKVEKIGEILSRLQDLPVRMIELSYMPW